MNEVEQQAADTVISRMDFLEEVALAAQAHWNVVEFSVSPKIEIFINAHDRLGELLRQNREANKDPALEGRET